MCAVGNLKVEFIRHRQIIKTSMTFLSPPSFPQLHSAAFTFPAIDNHAHPLLKAQHRSHFSFEGLISEAEGEALSRDSIHTLACLRATAQLGKILRLENASWDDIKVAREKLDYMDLCKMFFFPSGIQCIFIDDGLGGVQEYAEDFAWHDLFTLCPSKRIVRIESVAEVIQQFSLIHAYFIDPK